MIKLTFILLLLPALAMSQVKSVIVDSETKERIPYVNIWIENENTGTTSNPRGEFLLQNIDGVKTIVLSAIGYERKLIRSDSIKTVIELKPQITALQPLTIKAEKLSKEHTVGKFKKSKINSFFGCGENPWIVARYFEYHKDYEVTPYLKSIRIFTKSYVQNAKFVIRLYDINEKGEPGNYIYNRNIFGIARKGKKLTDIDISNLHIRFPKEGFFIAFEWLIIEPNKHEYKSFNESSKKKKTSFKYQPWVGMIPGEMNKESWIYSQGNWWEQQKITDSFIKNYTDKYHLLAVELTLTN